MSQRDFKLSKEYKKRYPQLVRERMAKIAEPIEKDERFYMVMRVTKHNPEMQLSPVFKHVQKAVADSEAKRLSQITPGWKFCIFEAIGVYETVVVNDVPNTTYIDLEPHKV